MFTRIKVVTSLILVLLIFGILQLVSGGLFIKALTQDKENFALSDLSSENVTQFTGAWIALNQTRIVLNRGMLRIQSNAANAGSSASLAELSERAKQLLATARTYYATYKSTPDMPVVDPGVTKKWKRLI